MPLNFNGKLDILFAGLFDKAKKKFLGDKEREFSGEPSQVAVAKATSLYDVDYWQPQDTGIQHLVGSFLCKKSIILSWFFSKSFIF